MEAQSIENPERVTESFEPDNQFSDVPNNPKSKSKKYYVNLMLVLVVFFLGLVTFMYIKHTIDDNRVGESLPKTEIIEEYVPESVPDIEDNVAEEPTEIFWQNYTNEWGAYSFEYPVYTNITRDPHSPNEKYWINLNFPSFKATVHISYKHIDGNLVTYLEDAHTLVTKHISKADAINDSLIIDRSRNLFGLAYSLEGSGAASPYQFFLTDSSTNFVRGALYFNTVPNNDSLEPVINFIKTDIKHLFSTFNWEELDKH